MSGCVGGGARDPGEDERNAGRSSGGTGASSLPCKKVCRCGNSSSSSSNSGQHGRPLQRDSSASLADLAEEALVTAGAAASDDARLFQYHHQQQQQEQQSQPEHQQQEQQQQQQQQLPEQEQQPQQQLSALPQLAAATMSPAAVLSLCGCVDSWTWSKRDRSHEVRLCGARGDTAHFHPNWSNGTAGVRGTRALNGGVYYWEVRVSQRVFGTSMMFGVGTRRARLHVDAFVNLLGEDENSCGLSHKGVFWQNGRGRQFTAPFRENEPTVVALLFHGHSGTLTYFKDGVCLGVAATGLDACGDELFPVVCSTAAKTEMTLGLRRRCFFSLQDRCRAAIAGAIGVGVGGESEVDALPLPKRLRTYVKDALQADGCGGGARGGGGQPFSLSPPR